MTGEPDIEPDTIEPDTKDWTWVLQRPCPECGLEAGAVELADLSRATRDVTGGWVGVLARPEARRRPADGVWSPLEYGCHVRDVLRVFGQRIELMLTQDDPVFADWDQDETALADRYGEQEPSLVSAQLAFQGEAVAQLFATVVGEQWQRPGRRSNGSTFTVGSLGRYFLHDVVHHLYDVSRPSAVGTPGQNG
jgi:hypothetical protein